MKLATKYPSEFAAGDRVTLRWCGRWATRTVERTEGVGHRFGGTMTDVYFRGGPCGLILDDARSYDVDDLTPDAS